MKYRAKGTFEAIQLKDPLEVANWFARVLPGWTLVELTEHRIAVDKIDPVVHAVHYFDGDWLVLSEGSDFPAVMRNDWFQDHYEPVTPAFASGGYVNGPGSSWVVKDGFVALKKEVSAAELLKGLASAWEKK